MNLGNLLNQYFKENSQVDFAKAAEVEQSTVSRWKNKGIEPTFENCLRIAKVLNRHPSEIFEVAKKPEFTELFAYFSPGYQPPEPPPEMSEVQRIYNGFSPEMQVFVMEKLKECRELQEEPWIPRRISKERK